MNSTFDPELKIWKGVSIPYSFSMDLMIGDLVMQSLLATPDRVLQITMKDDKSITCNDLRLSLIRVAQNLSKIGIKEDDVVGIIMPQSHLATFIIHGCVALGAVANPLHPSMSETDICGVFSQTKPKIIICQPDVIPKVQRALKDIDFYFRIYSTSSEVSHFLRAQNFLKPTGTEETYKRPKFSKPANEKLFAIICSSGSTGMPKGVCLTHATILSWAPLGSMMLKPDTQNVSYCPSPIYWATGFMNNFTIAIAPNELRIIPADKPFDAVGFLEAVEKYKISAATLSPPALAAILNHEKLPTYNLESVKSFMGVGSIVSKTLRDKFVQVFPDKQLNISYGMTETAVAMSKPFEYKKEYAVGSALFPNSQIKIIDDDGNNLDVGESGEICIKSLFKFYGYYNNPKATESAFDADEFYMSGDIGYFDEEGMLYVIDRKKEVLKSKGHQVNPSEIENVIQSIEGVELVSVVGLPDDFVGNLLTAVIVKKQGFEKLNEKHIVDYVASKLADFKHLNGGVYFFDKMPMTGSEKILKRIVLKEVMKIKMGSNINGNIKMF